MPHPKTLLRVAVAAVAVPGALAAVAAPAASAAELTPAAKAADSRMANAQQTSLADAQKNLGAKKNAVNTPSAEDISLPSMSNDLNGKSMDLKLPSS